MTPLSNRTLELLKKIVSPESQTEVIELLENECADNLPFSESTSPEALERFRFAVLKVGENNMEKLYKAVELAQVDWRDLLVAADFADDVDAHLVWATQEYGVE